MCHTEQDSWIIHRQSVVILLDPKLVYFHCKWSTKKKDLYSCAYVHIDGWIQMVMTVVTVEMLINSTLH